MLTDSHVASPQEGNALIHVDDLALHSIGVCNTTSCVAKGGVYKELRGWLAGHSKFGLALRLSDQVCQAGRSEFRTLFPFVSSAAWPAHAEPSVTFAE